MSAKDIQVGGSHYKQMTIQVTEFAERNGWTACPSNILKYLCRHDSKNGLQDLEKCLHYVDLRKEFTPDHRRNYCHSISMLSFVRANGYSGKRAECLYRLESWAYHGMFAEELKNAIRAYASECYPANS